MTECTFNMKTLDLRCVGHASDNDDDKGVCAALTSLMLTLAFDIEEASDMCEEKEIKIASGNYHIRVKPFEETREQIEFLFTAFVNGIYMLSEDPKLKQHITLTVLNEDEDNTDISKSSLKTDSEI